ncbi:MAG: Serine/threonine-protein kinase PknD [Phycisphaerae bacterium]|nr:Serine/threonine-protein kinase PknD [Phycisphaerae bacterium]
MSGAVDLKRVAAIFEEVHELDRSERGRFLDQACAGDPRLRAEVDALLSLHKTHHSDGAGAHVDRHEPGVLPPDLIAGYELVSEIHRGGQGVVYEALQQSTGRIVALKVMREGPFAGPRDLARFEREVHVLGQLRHPNIVAIHDSGSTAGHFYFVMDYIAGQPLDVYMAARRRALRETLALFATICEAVNAAHVRGIAHRDLKPGNIRVDQAGQPHILDFGLAKIAEMSAREAGAPARDDSPAPLGQRLAPRPRAAAPADAPLAAAPMTATGQFVGSVPWASPEQAAGLPGRIDLRTDVYSLGVLAFHMLTGRFPYDVGGSLGDVLDRIANAEPPPPSRVSRGLAPPSFVAGTIDDDVDTIVLKCLAKERDRRYQSAGEVAREVRRYLAGEPIEAKRDSGWYVLRKAIVRHRLAFSAAAAFVLLLAVATAILSFSYARESRLLGEVRTQRDRAVAAERDGQTRLSELTAARADEQVALLQAQRVNKFLTDMLAAANRAEQGGRPDVTVRELVELAARDLDDGALRDEPQVEIGVRDTLGAVYRALGMNDEATWHMRAALDLRRRTLPELSRDTMMNIGDLGLLAADRGDPATSEPLLRESLALARRLFTGDQRDLTVPMNNLGSFLLRHGKLAEAEALLRESLEIRRRILPADDLDVALAAGQYAQVLVQRGRYAAAEPLLRETVATYRARLGPEHQRLATVLSALANLLQTRHQLAEAEQLFREALAIGRKLLGDDHAHVAQTRNNLGTLLYAAGRFDEAEAELRESLRVRRIVHPPGHPEIAESVGNLAAVLWQRGRLDEAEPLWREALDTARTVFGERHSRTATCLNNLGVLLIDRKQFDEAETLLNEACEIERGLFGDRHPKVAATLHNLARNHEHQGRLEQAEAEFVEALAIRREHLTAAHPEALSSLRSLANVVARRERFAESRQLCHQWLELAKQPRPADHLEVRRLLGRNELAACDFVAAEQSLRACIELHSAESLPRWRRGYDRMLLGVALAGQQRWNEAAESFEEGCALLSAADTPADRWREIADHLAGLTGDAVGEFSAERWCALLLSAQRPAQPGD